MSKCQGIYSLLTNASHVQEEEEEKDVEEEEPYDDYEPLPTWSTHQARTSLPML